MKLDHDGYTQSQMCKSTKHCLWAGGPRLYQRSNAWSSLQCPCESILGGLEVLIGGLKGLWWKITESTLKSRWQGGVGSSEGPERSLPSSFPSCSIQIALWLVGTAHIWLTLLSSLHSFSTSRTLLANTVVGCFLLKLTPSINYHNSNLESCSL